MTTTHDEEMASLPITPTTNTRSKYESGDFSGSVFIISSDGEILNLPIPTKSAQDPLNWTKMKRARAFIALCIFSITGHIIVQGPAYLFVPLREQFSKEVGYLKPPRYSKDLLNKC